MRIALSVIMLSLTQPVLGQNLKAFAWLAGDWIHATDSTTTIESWSVRNDSTMVGSSVTTDNASGDILFEEALRIQSRNGTVSYIAVLPSTIATFQLKEKASGKFTFVLPENDFPSLIRYQKTKNGMNILLKGNEREMTMPFVRKKP